MRLLWTEAGGPAVTEPAHSGFGMTVIRGAGRHYLNGEAEIAFDPAGVRCTLLFPLAAPAAADAQD